ncbi:unnamed protein product [Parascedosporium putredinis]|uniref:Uncharacterized protein n=1 Tax=Parascedosporium putredinis TaxID=1442378 RepID=A0A9P1GYU3_9PEZI|nr:unnamed protein product [Parascedosporium putredinis]CAI7991117.1 unnamed protein product [Parascedosporium putredinis]
MTPTLFALAASIIALPALAQTTTATTTSSSPSSSSSVSSVQVVALLFLPDAHPHSLEASVVDFSLFPGSTFTTTSDGSTITAAPTPATWAHTRLMVDCPASKNAENDACREAGIYPAEIHMQDPNLYGGVTTYLPDNSTTTWTCQPGYPSAPMNMMLEVKCAKTTESDGTTQSEWTTYDNCYGLAHLRPVVITAGTEKLERLPPSIATLDTVSTIDANLYLSGLAGARQGSVQTVSSSSTAKPTGEAGEGGSDGDGEAGNEGAGIKSVGGIGLAVWALIGLATCMTVFG